MEKISVLTPTRGRRDFAYEMLESCIKTAERPDLIEFVFYIDLDDNSYHDIEDWAAHFNCEIVLVRGKRIVLSEMWNRCFDKSSGDIFFHCGDDLRFRTMGWDSVVRNKFDQFNDKIVFIFGNDGIVPPGTFGTHGFIHRRWVDIIGYFVPPYFSSDYNDTWLNDVAKKINRWIYVDIYTEHLHPIAGKSDWDKTHQERLLRHKKDDVESLYRRLSRKRDDDADKLITYINTEK